VIEPQMTDFVVTMLRTVFGHAAFQGSQQAIIDRTLAGGHSLVLMPTGGGKSLCYQLPAVMLSGLTVVLSPLIAPMKDQVDALTRRGIDAGFINSSLSKQERQARMAAPTSPSLSKRCGGKMTSCGSSAGYSGRLPG
jgi:ATP-dependent DNA helicase RecQ